VTHDSVGRCSLCDRLVLGLAGQDWCVLPWMLDDGAADAEVRPGPCHVRCLQELGVARDWAGAVEAYHLTRWPDWISGLDAGVRWRLHRSPHARRFHLWRADGRLSSFPYAAARHDPAAVTTELAEVGSGYAEALLTAMGTDGAGVEVPLPRVVAALDLTNRYPDISGWITHRLTNVGTAHQPELIDFLVARHPLALDSGCRTAAYELMRRSV
jgi:hypothetical protein